jgi:hypothetical protein
MSASDTIFPGAEAAAEEAVGAAGSIIAEFLPKPPAPSPAPAAPTPPAAPDNSAAIAARNAAAEEQRRRAQYGRSSTNPTGGLGVVAPASVAAKSLLGL